MEPLFGNFNTICKLQSFKLHAFADNSLIIQQIMNPFLMDLLFFSLDFNGNLIYKTKQFEIKELVFNILIGVSEGKIFIVAKSNEFLFYFDKEINSLDSLNQFKKVELPSNIDNLELICIDKNSKYF